MSEIKKAGRARTITLIGMGYDQLKDRGQSIVGHAGPAQTPDRKS